MLSCMARAKGGTTDGAETKEDKGPGHEGLTCPAEDHRGLERQVRSRRQDVSEGRLGHCYSHG